MVNSIEISSWMFLTMVSAAFFLGIGKRRNELLKYGSTSRKNLSFYTIDFLNQSLQFSMILAVVFYSLACADTNTSVANAGVDLLWSVPIVLIICLRYLMLLNDDSDGDPITIIFNDRILFGLILGYVGSVIFMLYIK